MQPPGQDTYTIPGGSPDVDDAPERAYTSDHTEQVLEQRVIATELTDGSAIDFHRKKLSSNIGEFERIRREVDAAYSMQPIPEAKTAASRERNNGSLVDKAAEQTAVVVRVRRGKVNPEIDSELRLAA